MAAAALIQITGQISGAPGDTTIIGPISISSAAANYQKQLLTLASGANTITVPTGTGMPAPTGCVIVLPSANTIVTTLKGVTGDTGIALGKVTTQLLTWDPTAVPASF